uniref:J domain-containing protein n=1 Tax=Fagus sylvatica TaxID=28930 RepID=A0A2N9IJ85_FAGSY
MTDLLLDYAKEKWIDGKFKEAYDLATTAKELDPYFLNVNNLCAALQSRLRDTINSTYCKLVKLVHPEVLSSPVAEGALRFITIAWETLTNESTKETYDVRNGVTHKTGTWEWE